MLWTLGLLALLATLALLAVMAMVVMMAVAAMATGMRALVLMTTLLVAAVRPQHGPAEAYRSLWRTL
eukprot:5783453-Alexandrium_andersonii.AAC.1